MRKTSLILLVLILGTSNVYAQNCDFKDISKWSMGEKGGTVETRYGEDSSIVFGLQDETSDVIYAFSLLTNGSITFSYVGKNLFPRDIIGARIMATATIPNCDQFTVTINSALAKYSSASINVNDPNDTGGNWKTVGIETFGFTGPITLTKGSTTDNSPVISSVSLPSKINMNTTVPLTVVFYPDGGVYSFIIEESVTTAFDTMWLTYGYDTKQNAQSPVYLGFVCHRVGTGKIRVKIIDAQRLSSGPSNSVSFECVANTTQKSGYIWVKTPERKSAIKNLSNELNYHTILSGGGAFACAAIPEAVITKICTIGLGTYALATGLLSLKLSNIADDPPDYDYKIYDEVKINEFTRVTPGDGVTQEFAGAWNNLLDNRMQTLGYANAILRAMERQQGAEASNDAEWEKIHSDSVMSYYSKLEDLLQIEPGLRKNLVNSWSTSDLKITESEFKEYISNVSSNGLPAWYRDSLTNMGATENEINMIRDNFISASSNGDISYLGLLSDYKLDNAVNNLLKTSGKTTTEQSSYTPTQTHSYYTPTPNRSYYTPTETVGAWEELPSTPTGIGPYGNIYKTPSPPVETQTPSIGMSPLIFVLFIASQIRKRFK